MGLAGSLPERDTKPPVILSCLARGGTQQEVFRGVMTVKPGLHAIEKIKSLPINDAISFKVIFDTEENRGGEDVLVALHDAAVVAAVFAQAEEIEHLCDSLEADYSIFLLHGQGGHANRDETVLS
jgi:hypothetical protein